MSTTFGRAAQAVRKTTSAPINLCIAFLRVRILDIMNYESPFGGVFLTRCSTLDGHPPSPSAKKDLVLVIDDDPPILSALARLLRREPYDVVTTVHPDEALERVRTQDVSLVIADQRMPEMRGTELLKAVRKISPKTACVILTGHADLSDVAGAMNEGAVHRLIKKPWDDQVFKEEIRRLLQGGIPERLPGALGKEPPLPERVVVRLDCRGKSVEGLLSILWGSVDPPEGKPARSAVVFEHLREFPGSLSTLLSEVVRRVLHSRLRTALRDERGLERE